MLRAVDGKHVTIQNPHNSGSTFFNYKGTFSLVLMAVASADYRFVVADIGSYGSNPDGAIFRNSKFGSKFYAGEIPLPPDRVLPNYPTGGHVPYGIVGDEAFPARKNLFRPHPGAGGRTRLEKKKRIYNYRLSRARRIVENVFGILVQRFRIYQRRMNLQPANATLVMQATVVLHNFLTKPDANIAEIRRRLSAANRQLNANRGNNNVRNNGNDEEEDLGRFEDINNMGGLRSAQEAIRIRDLFTDSSTAQQAQYRGKMQQLT